MRKYGLDNYKLEEIFDEEYIDTIEEKIELLRQKGVKRYRIKTIKSGDMLECEIYPYWNIDRKLHRAKKGKESRNAQKNLNNKNAIKKAIRLINANFEANKDIWVRLGYADENLPGSYEKAKKDLQNYIRRIKTYCKKKELPDLKYFYVTEEGQNKRWHHHIFMNFNDRDMAENMWKNELYPQARRLKDNPMYKFEGAVRYSLKETKKIREKLGKVNFIKRWGASRNLKPPTIIKADCKITRKKAFDIVNRRLEPKKEFEKIYKGYKFNDIDVYTSEWVEGYYIYVRMRKNN